MTKFRCTRGCGKYHDSKKDCPHESVYDPARRIETRANPPPPPPPPPPPGPAPGNPAASAPAPGGKVGALEFGVGTAQTVDRAQAAAIRVNPNWVLDEEHNYTFWSTLANCAYKICRFVDKWFLELEDKDCINAQLFVINPADQQLIKGAPRRLATSIMRSAGNETLEQAQNAIDGLGGLVFLGGILLGVGEHFVRAWKISPRMVRARAEEEKKAAEAQAMRELNRGPSAGTPALAGATG